MRYQLGPAILIGLMFGGMVFGTIWGDVINFIHGKGALLIHAIQAWIKSNEGNLVNEITTEVQLVVKDIPALVDPAQREAAIVEILNSAKSFGTSWGAKLLTAGEDKAKEWLSAAPTSDLQRYLAYARSTINLAAKYGTQAVTAPGLHSTLDLVIAAVLKAVSAITAA